MITISLHTKYYMPGFNGSQVIVIKLKTKHRSYAATWIYIIKKNLKQQLHI